MPRLLLAFLMALPLAGCAVSSSVSTASVTAQGDDVVVRRSQWGTTLACGPGAADGPACTAFSTDPYAP